MSAVGEGLVAGGKPFRGLADSSPVPVFAEIQICYGVLDNDGHGLIVRDFQAEGAVGEVPRGKGWWRTGQKEAARLDGLQTGPLW